MSGSGPALAQTQYAANMPGAATPMVEPGTGNPSSAWFNLFLKLFLRTGGPKGIPTTAATTQVLTVTTLPTVSLTSARAFVNDALAPVFGVEVVQGGTSLVPVYFDGRRWRVG